MQGSVLDGSKTGKKRGYIDSGQIDVTLIALFKLTDLETQV